ncbi:MAG: F0F1 ATP synthase subunit epsilon [Bacillota bacterium]|jgi:F-type H+-transporting ATPase subunit epsilon
MATLRLEVVTPVRIVHSQEANLVIANTMDGEIGVMAGHIPLVTVLIPGVMRVKDDSEGEQRIAISGGFLEVSPDSKLTVLAETAEMAEEIDVERARRARERALQRLSGNAAGEVDVLRAELALRRAIARLQAAGASIEEQ